MAVTKQKSSRPSPNDKPKNKKRRAYTDAELARVGQLVRDGMPLTTQEAAIYLRVAEGFLIELRFADRRAKELAESRGENPPAPTGPRFSLVGTLPRYTKADLDAWMPTNTTPRKASPNVGRPPDGARP